MLSAGTGSSLTKVKTDQFLIVLLMNKQLNRTSIAHLIRNSSTKVFQAAATLSAKIKWCITGTPIQNSLNDLRSLVKFLRVPLLDDKARFHEYIVGNRRSKRGSPRPIADFEKLKMLLESICLRRSIQSVLPKLSLTHLDIPYQFSEVERQKYNELAGSCTRSIDTVISKQSSAVDNRAILIAILRLRIFCNTGVMSKEAIDEPLYTDEIDSLFQQTGGADCSDCGAPLIGTIDSLDEYLRNPEHCLKCLTCQQQSRISINDEAHSMGCVVADDVNGIDKETLTYPSKLKTVLADIKEHCIQEKR